MMKKGYIENALVTLNEDNSFSVKLPAENMIDYANRITVTVLDKDGAPLKDISVTVSDAAENSESGITNADGEKLLCRRQTLTIPTQTAIQRLTVLS